MDYPNRNRIVVKAKGQDYLMTADRENPIDTFGINIKEVIQTTENNIILIHDTDVQLIDRDGTIWQSERISWDGIKDLKISR